MAPRTPEPAGPSLCSACGAPFECGAEAGAPSCWCYELPKLSSIAGARCLCPRCLEEQLKKEAAYKT